MKILMVNKFLYHNGGSETYIFKLGEHLKNAGHEVQYFGMEHEGRCVSNNAEQYTEDMDFHTESKLKKLTYPLKTIYSTDAKKKISIVLEDFNPDVVHLNNFNYQLTPSIIYAIKKYEKKSGKNIKIIYTAHDCQLVCPNHLMLNNDGSVCDKCLGGNYLHCIKDRCIHSSALKSFIGSIEAETYRILRTYRYIDTVICPSEFIKRTLDKNPALTGRTVVLQNFVESLLPTKEEKEDYVLYFGRYSPEKGVKTIIDTNEINFICAGNGIMEDEINSAPHITNVGFKTGNDLTSLISKARCCVFPSICNENCPLSVMESIMLGTPVIGADIGGIPELIDEGKTGFLFKSGNTEDFLRAIKKLVDDPVLASNMSDNCLKYHYYSVLEYTEKLLKIYND